MELIPNLRDAALALLLIAGSTASAQTCYVGGADSGGLEFRGAVDGTGFTGTFGDFEVRYCMTEEQPTDGSIDVTVALASADSNNRDRDEALLGPEFFAIEQFPESTWTSTAIRANGDGYEADGELTLRDITAPQPILFTLSPDGDDLVAEGRFTMGGSTEIDRSRFDVGIGEFEDPEFVRNRVDVTFEVVLSAE